MKRRLVIVAVAAVLAALAFAAARPPMASAASLTTRLRDQVTRQNLRVLRSYIEEWTLDHGGVFPDTADVARGGALAAGRAWPQNPWTNAAMQAGTSRGDFLYGHGSFPEESYILRATLSGGRSFTLTPTSFPGRLQSLRDAFKDSMTQRAVRVLQGYVDQWSLMNNGTLPTADDLAATGAVGLAHDYWPANAWTNAAMAPGSVVGEYTYTPGSGDDYTVVGHLSGGDYTVTATAPSLRVFLDSMRDRVVRLSVDKLAAGIELYALDNNDVFPASVSLATLGNYVDDWPVNPWTNAFMAQDSSTGDYTYQVAGIGGAYTISGHLSGGSDYTVSREWYEIAGARIGGSLRNYCARYGAQVLKDYVDEWRAANGSLPTSDQMSATGDVGLAHTWWPVNPWTNDPMASDGGDMRGYFTYTDNGDGTFSLSVGQLVIPQRYPGDPVWPPSYTAQ